jgi:putative addiction module component (TIGR02574 family)
VKDSKMEVMSSPAIDPASLSIEERLRLIDALWQSIEQAVARGDIGAAQAVERWSDVDPDLLATLEREADEADTDPSTTISWEALLAELKQKRG